MQELADLAFVDRRENIILMGPSGTGKTHLEIALVVRATRKGCKDQFITEADLTFSW